MPAKYWRFEGGYQDAPEPEPEPPAPYPMMAGWNCVPNYASPWGGGPWGYPGWQPPQAFMPGPVYINGLQTPPPVYANLSPPPPDVDENLPSAPPEDDEEKKKEEKCKKKKNYYAPPSMPPHCNYMFDNEHTILHIFNRTSEVWKEKYKNENK